MKTILAITIALLPIQAYAIVRDVEIPMLGDQDKYVSDLLKDYPLPKGLSYEISGKHMYVSGDAGLSSSWSGKQKAEDDSRAEKQGAATGAVILGVGAAVLMARKIV